MYNLDNYSNNVVVIIDDLPQVHVHVRVDYCIFDMLVCTVARLVIIPRLHV